ncbi:DUF2213 domain-containing protein [Lactiplantibacillus xiangfangensis]|uniref:DUF2213 domain-containing protein n=1 Tax=Lactiplantibacillus xiangfangensis TaxID=942150 RepID=UPI00384D243A
MKFYDTAELGKYTETPEGYLHGEFPITRPGVFPYLRSGGSVSQVAKLPEEVFSKETIESANNKPLTNEHPNVGVDVNNYKKLSVGMTDGDAHVEDNKLVVGATITDPETIADIKSGSKRELSIGFMADVPAESGEYGGNQYDAAQRHIKINHIAIVSRGRAGHDVSIHDDAAFVMDDKKQGGNLMPAHLIIDSQQFDVDQKVADSFDDKKKELATAKAKVAQLEKELGQSQDDTKKFKKESDSLAGERDALKAQLDEAQKKTMDQDALDKRIDTRLALQTSASRFVGDSFDFKGKSDREIKVAAIKTVNDSFDSADKSDDYVNAFFDSAVAEAKKKGFTHSATGKEIETDSVDKLKNERANAYK